MSKRAGQPATEDLSIVMADMLGETADPSSHDSLGDCPRDK
jgi:hypothetical protein